MVWFRVKNQLHNNEQEGFIYVVLYHIKYVYCALLNYSTHELVPNITFKSNC